MNKLKPLVCPQCGGKINRNTYICEYCGTQFKKEGTSWSEPIQFEVLRPGTHVLVSHMRIPEEMIYYMDVKDASEIALKRLSEELAQCMIPFMDVETYKDEIDYQRLSTTVKARIRVLEPTYHF